MKKILVNKKQIYFKLDSGAYLNVLPYNVFKNFKIKPLPDWSKQA